MLLAATGELSAGYGAYLAQTLLALVAVSALAVVVLRMLRRRSGARGLRVVARLSLEPRRSLYVIEAAGKFLLVGVGDGPMTTLAELDAAKVAALEVPEAPGGPAGWGEILRRVLGRGGSDG